MLFRSLVMLGDVRESCLGSGSALSTDSDVFPECWDSWSVQIRDSSGKLITKDIPRRPDQPKQGPSLDASVADGSAM
jgi:hypothetical protein